MNKKTNIKGNFQSEQYVLIGVVDDSLLFLPAEVSQFDRKRVLIKVFIPR